MLILNKYLLTVSLCTTTHYRYIRFASFNWRVLGNNNNNDNDNNNWDGDHGGREEIAVLRKDV